MNDERKKHRRKDGTVGRTCRKERENGNLKRKKIKKEKERKRRRKGRKSRRRRM